MSSLISIIVPVYKAEAFLNKCVDSILASTYRNIEVILVDDGSPDNSPAICDEYARIDERVKVIHKENGGVSSARNAGLNIAKGEYIGFVDSDDWIDKDLFSVLYRMIIDTSSDLSVTNYKIVDSYFKISNEYCYDMGKVLVLDSAKAMLSLFDCSLFDGSPCARLYKKTTLSNLTFNQEITFCEDMVFNAEFLLNSSSASYSNYCGYYYFQHPNSAIHLFNDSSLTILKANNELSRIAYSCLDKTELWHADNRIINSDLYLALNAADHKALDKSLYRRIRDNILSHISLKNYMKLPLKNKFKLPLFLCGKTVFAGFCRIYRKCQK